LVMLYNFIIVVMLINIRVPAGQHNQATMPACLPACLVTHYAQYGYAPGAGARAPAGSRRLVDPADLRPAGADTRAMSILFFSRSWMDVYPQPIFYSSILLYYLRLR